MRDPSRIDPVLQAVREAWIRHPQLRLLQLLLNLVQDDEVSDLPSRWFFSTAYNLEDDLVVARLREVYFAEGDPCHRTDAHEDDSPKIDGGFAAECCRAGERVEGPPRHVLTR